MNYFISFFSHALDGSDGQFTIIVSAESIDVALEKCKALILLQRERIFEDAARIYLDDVTEIEQFPEEAMLLQCEFSTPDDSIVDTYPQDDVISDFSVWEYDEGDDGQLGTPHEVEVFLDLTK
jgi:hypothetical protein